MNHKAIMTSIDYETDDDHNSTTHCQFVCYRCGYSGESRYSIMPEDYSKISGLLGIRNCGQKKLNEIDIRWTCDLSECAGKNNEIIPVEMAKNYIQFVGR